MSPREGRSSAGQSQEGIEVGVGLQRVGDRLDHRLPPRRETWRLRRRPRHPYGIRDPCEPRPAEPVGLQRPVPHRPPDRAGVDAFEELLVSVVDPHPTVSKAQHSTTVIWPRGWKALSVPTDWVVTKQGHALWQQPTFAKSESFTLTATRG